jgi:hypothetical protein
LQAIYRTSCVASKNSQAEKTTPAKQNQHTEIIYFKIKKERAPQPSRTGDSLHHCTFFLPGEITSVQFSTPARARIQALDAEPPNAPLQNRDQTRPYRA